MEEAGDRVKMEEAGDRVKEQAVHLGGGAPCPLLRFLPFVFLLPLRLHGGSRLGTGEQQMRWPWHECEATEAGAAAPGPDLGRVRCREGRRRRLSRFLLAVGSIGERRGSSRGRPRSTAARGLVLPPPKQSRGGRCRVTSDGHAARGRDGVAGERAAASERKLPMLPCCVHAFLLVVCMLAGLLLGALSLGVGLLMARCRCFAVYIWSESSDMWVQEIFSYDDWGN